MIFYDFSCFYMISTKLRKISYDFFMISYDFIWFPNLLYDFKNLHCDLLCKNHYLEKNIENVSQKKLREKYYHKEFDYYSEVKPDLINEKHTVSSLNKIHYDSNNYDHDSQPIISLIYVPIGVQCTYICYRKENDWKRASRLIN